MNTFAAVVLQRQGEDVRGWSVEDLLGFTLQEPSDAGTPSTAMLGDATGALSTIPGNARRRDGSTFPVEVTCAVLHHGSERFLIVHFCDVSARYAAESRLRQLSTALEQTAEHAAILDTAGTILYANRAFEIASGFPRAALLGMNITELRSPEQGRSFYSELSGVLTNGGTFHGEVVHQNAWGGLYAVDQQVAPFTDPVTGARYYIATGRDVSERRFRDPLTGLPSRTSFLERVGVSVARTERRLTSRAFALGFVDIDRFKNVNDAHGKSIGDQVLLEIAFRIRQTLRKIDAVALISHLERDEFAILVDELRGVEDVRRIGQRLLDTIREPITLSSGTTIVVTASIGFALMSAHYTSPEAILQDAETAMRRAKGTPDDPCQVFDVVMHERARSRLQLEADLRVGISREQFILHYQPIVSLYTGRITSCEALVRWCHPTKGFIPPLEFIEVAEESGLIVPLGQHILQLACRQARAWADSGVGELSVAVNISPRQLTEGQLVDTVRRCLSETGLDPSLLKLEITESVAAKNPVESSAALHALRKLGIQLLMDDFGTGYSSLSRLMRFPLHKLKIDRTFVSPLPDNEQAEAVAATIVTMAHNFGLQVIAEGVETPEQAHFLRSIGCEEMQGFLFSKPVDAAAFTELLTSGRCLQLESQASLLPSRTRLESRSRR